MAKEYGQKDDSYLDKAKGAVSKGRQELEEAKARFNRIKGEIADWDKSKQDLFEEVTQTYNAEARKLRGEEEETTALVKVKAFWNTLPALVNREDPKRKRFGSLLRTLVNGADDIYGVLGKTVNDYEEKFEKVDEENENLLENAKTALGEIKAYDKQYKELKKGVYSLEKRIAGKITEEKRIELRKELLNKKREFNEVERERSSAIGHYTTSKNILEAIEGIRDGQQTIISEGKHMHDNLQTNMDSLRPLFDMIISGVDVVEFQNEAMKTWDMLKGAMNPAMGAAALMSKGMSNILTERMGEKFITDETITAVKAITYEHKLDLETGRRAKEDAMVEEILGNTEKTKKGVVLEKGKDGVYRVPEAETQEDEKKSKRKKK